jgi:hypothetical protein
MIDLPPLDALVTLREIDQTLGMPKGSAFRAFKRLALIEGQDFWLLTPSMHGLALGTLRQGRRLYASSIHAVVLSPEAAQRVLAHLQAGSG